jgi:hypothetical protein
MPQSRSNPLADNGITGEVLNMMDVESLTELGVNSIGRRLAILKGVYNTKVAQGLPIGADDYVPPCTSHQTSGYT